MACFTTPTKTPQARSGPINVHPGQGLGSWLATSFPLIPLVMAPVSVVRCYAIFSFIMDIWQALTNIKFICHLVHAINTPLLFIPRHVNLQLSNCKFNNVKCHNKETATDTCRKNIKWPTYSSTNTAEIDYMWVCVSGACQLARWRCCCVANGWGELLPRRDGPQLPPLSSDWILSPQPPQSGDGPSYVQLVNVTPVIKESHWNWKSHWCDLFKIGRIKTVFPVAIILWQQNIAHRNSSQQEAGVALGSVLQSSSIVHWTWYHLYEAAMPWLS